MRFWWVEYNADPANRYFSFFPSHENQRTPHARLNLIPNLLSSQKTLLSVKYLKIETGYESEYESSRQN